MHAAQEQIKVILKFFFENGNSVFGNNLINHQE
jgi:hypothetical protein